MLLFFGEGVDPGGCDAFLHVLCNRNFLPISSNTVKICLSNITSVGNDMGTNFARLIDNAKIRVLSLELCPVSLVCWKVCELT